MTFCTDQCEADKRLNDSSNVNQNRRKKVLRRHLKIAVTNLQQPSGSRGTRTLRRVTVVDLLSPWRTDKSNNIENNGSKTCIMRGIAFKMQFRAIQGTRNASMLRMPQRKSTDFSRSEFTFCRRFFDAW